MTQILAANMALQMRRLDSMPEGTTKTRIWRDLRIALLDLRKTELYAQRLDIEREKHPKTGQAEKAA
jgi:hypothetical protein